MGTDNQNSQEDATQEVRTFTQEEVNSFLAKDRKQMAEKYADYEALKEKAARLDQIEEDAKSELQKATERAEKLQAEFDPTIYNYKSQIYKVLLICFSYQPKALIFQNGYRYTHLYSFLH